MTTRFVRLLTVSAAVAALLAPVVAGGSSPAAAAVPSGAAFTAAGRDHVRAINAARASVGVTPVQGCLSLRRAADAHVRSMAESGALGHEGTDGSTPGSRARSAGYRGDWIGENVAVGYAGVGQVIEAWLSSPGHRANLLDPRYRHVGVATAVSADGQVYWVQVFGQARRCR